MVYIYNRLRGKLIIMCLCITIGQIQFTLNPANGSIIAHPPGRVNIQVQCSLHDVDNQQLLTAWNIAGLGGVEGLLDISRAPSVELGGTPSNGMVLLDTYRDQATISEITMDMHGATVYCGHYPRSYAIFHLRLSSKSSCSTQR
jgi:hypothetical protein